MDIPVDPKTSPIRVRADAVEAPRSIAARTEPDYWRHDEPKPELGDIIEVFRTDGEHVTVVFTGELFVGSERSGNSGSTFKHVCSPGAVASAGWRPKAKGGAS